MTMLQNRVGPEKPRWFATQPGPPHEPPRPGDPPSPGPQPEVPEPYDPDPYPKYQDEPPVTPIDGPPGPVLATELP